jgi:cell division transport system permease protein
LTLRLKGVYAISQALRALRRHLTSTLATFTTSLVSFSLLFLLGLVLWNLDKVVRSLEREVEIAAFLKPDADIATLREQVAAFEEVLEVRLVSKEEALAQLQLSYPYLSQARELIENPLPNTLRVVLKNPNQVRAAARKIERLEGIESTTYGGEITEQLLKVLGGVRLAALLLISLLLLDTLFSVMGTIRLSIENRREELRVMQLVGATRRFIQGPFVVEGLFLTLLASLAALGLGLLAYGFLASALQQLLPFLPVLGTNEVLLAAGALVLLAVVLGVGGAYLSSRANLKESDL